MPNSLLFWLKAMPGYNIHDLNREFTQFLCCQVYNHSYSIHSQYPSLASVPLIPSRIALFPYIVPQKPLLNAAQETTATEDSSDQEEKPRKDQRTHID